VSLQDPDAAALDRAVRAIAVSLEDLAAYDLLGGGKPAEVVARVFTTCSLAEALDGTEYVQENAPERLDVKCALYAELDRLAPADTILASSTSGLLPSALFEALEGRARCLVAHPINPPYLVPAVELVPSPWTNPDVVERTAAILAGVGQTPLRMRKELPGFIMNRLQGAIKHEAWRLVAGGYASPEDVDRGISEGIGLRWSFIGPFETSELNAPGGIRDYVGRYGPLYEEIGAGQREPVPWSGDALAEVESSRRAVLPLTGIAARQEWRDRRLTALAAHKREADERHGK
jgi:3-hydroxyacyl-CoA dehydrogenase